MKGGCRVSGKKRILIVDDVEINRLVLKKQFESHYDIFFADNGQTALDILNDSENRIELVLLDIVMPVLDGFSVLEAMRASPVLSRIPAIMITGSGDCDSEVKAIELGAHDYLTKPVNGRIALAKAHNAIKLMENERLISENLLRSRQQENELLYSIIFDRTNIAVVEYKLDGGEIRALSDLSKLLYGVYDAEIMESFDRNQDAESIDMVRKYAREMIESKASVCPKNLQLCLRAQDGSMKWFSLGSVLQTDDNGKPLRILFTLKDIDESKRLEDRLIYNAEFDRLTGIFNKDTFCRNAMELISTERDRTFMLIRLDIQHFKVINDIFGAHVGDRLLKYIAEKMRGYASANNGICGRVSGDVFVLCLDYSEENVKRLEGTIREDLENYDLNFELVAPFGVYVIHDPDGPVEIMIDKAAMAVKTVKGNYIQRYAYYDAKMREQLLMEQSISSVMNHAMEQEQFVIYLQPKCRLDNGAVFGAEALVRWLHPEKGVVSPGVFIPIFERNGFIMKLDLYVCEQVCRVIRRWMNEGADVLPVSVNISRVSLYNPTLCEDIYAITQKYSIPPRLLEIEITETAYTENSQCLLDFMDKLHALGFIILMDDFGSGYSSLNMLKEISVDVLKIDLRFLSGNDDSDRGGSILSSMMRMARWLEIPVIVEGVETADQARFLRSIGCNNAQGFLYYRPMPVEQYDELPKTAELATNPVSAYIEDFEAYRVWSFDKNIDLLLHSIIGGVGIYEVSNGNVEILRYNDELLKVFGCDTEYMIRNCTDALKSIHYSDRHKVQKMFGKARAERGIADCQYRHIMPDGTKWLHARVRYLSGEINRALFFVSIDDITKMKSDEQRYIEDAKRYDEISDMLGTENFDYDVEADVMRYSVRENGKLSFSHELRFLMENIDTLSIVAPQDRSFMRDAIKRAMSAPERGIIEYRRLNGDKYEWYRVNYVSIDNAEGKVTRIFGGIKNIHVERMLYTSSEPVCYGLSDDPISTRFELMQTIINNMRGGVCVAEFDNEFTEGIIRYSNPAFRELCCKPGTPESDFSIKMCHPIHPDDLSEIIRVCRESAHDWKIAEMSYRSLGAGKNFRWYSIKTQRIRSAGKKLTFLSLITDISTIKRQESDMNKVLNNVPCGIAVIEAGEKARVLFYNEALKKAHQRMNSDIEREFVHDAFSAVHPDDRESFRSAIFDALSDVTEITCVYRAVFSENTKPFFTLLRAKQIDMRGGHPVLLCAFSDINDREITSSISHESERGSFRIYESKQGKADKRICDDFMRYLGLRDDNSIPEDSTEFGRLLRYTLGRISDALAVYSVCGGEIELLRSNKGYNDISTFRLDGKPLIDICDSSIANAFAEAKANGFASCVYRQAISDSPSIWFQIKLIPIYRDSDNHEAMICASFSDITVFKETERDLRRSNECFRTALAGSGTSVWEYDYETSRILQTEHSRRIHGYNETIENVPQKLISDGYVHPESASEFLEMYNSLREGACMAEGIFRVRNLEGTGYWYEHIRYTNVFDEDGKPYKAFGMSEDVTFAKETERLYLRELQYKKALAPDLFATFLINITKGIVEETENNFSGHCDVMEEVSLEALYKSGAERVLEDEAVEFLMSRTAGTLSADFSAGRIVSDMEFRIYLDDDTTMWVSYSEHILRDPKSHDLLAFVYLRDIDSRKKEELELRASAQRDSMTGLLNKSAAIKKMEEALQNSDSGYMQAMLMFDLDNFKDINDEYGHLYGDEVLREFSEKLRKTFDGNIIGRFGGDEFFILVKVNSLAELESLITEFYQTLNEISSVDVQIRSTVGIACRKEQATSCTELIDAADKAMYKAKQLGKNRHYFYEQ